MYLVFDIGGTKMRLALSFDGVSLDSPTILQTPQTFEEGIQVFEDTFHKFEKKEELKFSVGGIAGVIDRKTNILLRSPNLPFWQDRPVKEAIEKIVNCEVFLENDADLAGLGEAVKGAGKGYPIVAYITLGTGIGGVRIVNQKIDINSCGFEPGHQYVDLDGSVAGSVLDFEGLVSGTAIEKRYQVKPDELNDERVWDEIINVLAYGINNVIVFWSPDVLVLGGGVSESLPIDKVSRRLNEILTIFPKVPEIKKSELGDVAGLHGALIYLKQKI